MCFDFPHGVPAVNLLAAVRALVVPQAWNGVRLALEPAGPVPPNLLDVAAATGRALCDFNHRRCPR